jgi:hypothetical protein
VTSGSVTGTGGGNRNTYHVPAGRSLMPISGFLSNEDKRIMYNAVQTSGIVHSMASIILDPWPLMGERSSEGLEWVYGASRCTINLGYRVANCPITSSQKKKKKKSSMMFTHLTRHQLNANPETSPSSISHLLLYYLWVDFEA